MNTVLPRVSLHLRVALLGGATLLLALLPHEVLTGMPRICVFKKLFDIECAGCGMTRALSALLHGDIAAAVAYNAGVLIVFPLLLSVLIVDLMRMLRNSVGHTRTS